MFTDLLLLAGLLFGIALTIEVAALKRRLHDLTHEVRANRAAERATASIAERALQTATAAASGAPR